MKTLLHTILICLCTLLIYQAQATSVAPDRTAKKVFTKIELSGILQMIDFTDRLVRDSTGLTNSAEAYHAFFEKMKPNIQKGKLTPLLCNDSVKFKFLESLSTKGLTTLWRMEQKSIHLMTDHGWQETPPVKVLRTNIEGSYLEYMAKLGQSDHRYTEWHNLICKMKDLPAALGVWIPLHHDEFDFANFDDRLFACYYLMRICEPVKDKLE